LPWCSTDADDRARYDAASLGLELAAALEKLYPDRFDIDGSRQLIGSVRVFSALKAGIDPRYLPAFGGLI